MKTTFAARSLLALLRHAASPAQAGVVEQSLTRANAKVEAAVLHVRRSLGRKARSTRRRGPSYVSILWDMQRSLDEKGDPEVATQSFCKFCRSPGELYLITATARGKHAREFD